MASVGIAQFARRQIKHSNEESDEHAGVVALTSVLIQGLHDTVRSALVR